MACMFMSRIQTTFQRLQGEGRKALIPFITAGFPDAEETLPLMHGLVEAGADVIELGVPFSDPMADGPVIQRASERAIAGGMTLRKIFDLVKVFRTRDTETPVVLMGYANPIEAMGIDTFVTMARHAGVDGVLVVDYPPEECDRFANAMSGAGLDPIFLLAPTSTEERFSDVARLGKGYIYYVSLAGVTGAGNLDTEAVIKRIPHIREKVGMPVGVGFGIRDADSARRIASVADAVVIGSRIIEEIERSEPDQRVANVKAFLKPIRAALDERIDTAGGQS